ncbi:hypothetical protein SAMN02745126_00868 [Enhydrobacter aerosaccus]|uniref:UrcA family protein n=1 Tax=Enhydrobacter aerosaccus TaxID=225324 RepID=A0A1T4KBE2_9HYPH|nr:hypothetical protein [Enhydrobacter aerosaccus]SJZ39754.1 hypothetical protein SAMN02745126_00868 [Enhydrobacter aerosaccus]
MRFLSSTAVLAVLCVAACAPAYEDGHLSRAINQQRVIRDNCLSTEAVSLDDRRSPAEAIGRAAASACTAQNDKLIQLMSTMDRSGELHITDAVRKDAVVKATSYVLNARAQAR